MYFPLSAELALPLIGFIETEKSNSVIVPASVNVPCPMKLCYSDHMLREDSFRQLSSEVLERCYWMEMLERCCTLETRDSKLMGKPKKQSHLSTTRVRTDRVQSPRIHIHHD